MEVKVLNNQNAFDISIQHNGSVDAITDICRENDISINEILASGSSIVVPSVITIDIVNYFTLKPKPATRFIQTNNSFSNGFSNGFN